MEQLFNTVPANVLILALQLVILVVQGMTNSRLTAIEGRFITHLEDHPGG